MLYIHSAVHVVAAYLVPVALMNCVSILLSAEPVVKQSSLYCRLVGTSVFHTECIEQQPLGDPSSNVKGSSKVAISHKMRLYRTELKEINDLYRTLMRSYICYRR